MGRDKIVSIRAQFEHKQKEEQQQKKASSAKQFVTGGSQEVTHPTTGPAQRFLTSQSEREGVC